jgi:hypothetical protein
VGFKIGFQGTTVRAEGPRVKLYVSNFFECKTHNTEESMMGQTRGKFVYRGSPGNVCKTQNNGSANVSPPIREPAIEKLVQVCNRETVGTIRFRQYIETCNIYPIVWQDIFCMSLGRKEKIRENKLI